MKYFDYISLKDLFICLFYLIIVRISNNNNDSYITIHKYLDFNF